MEEKSEGNTQQQRNETNKKNHMDLCRMDCLNNGFNMDMVEYNTHIYHTRARILNRFSYLCFYKEINYRNRKTQRDSFWIK